MENIKTFDAHVPGYISCVQDRMHDYIQVMKLTNYNYITCMKLLSLGV